MCVCVYTDGVCMLSYVCGAVRGASITSSSDDDDDDVEDDDDDDLNNFSISFNYVCVCV